MNIIDSSPKTKKSFSIVKLFKQFFNLFKTSSLTETRPNDTAPSLNSPNKAEVPQQEKSQQTETTSFWEMPTKPGTNTPLSEQTKPPLDRQQVPLMLTREEEKQTATGHETISELMRASFNK